MKRSKQITDQMISACHASIEEFGTVKTAEMIRKLYNSDELTAKQASVLMLVCANYYMGTNYNHFNL